MLLTGFKMLMLTESTGIFYWSQHGYCLFVPKTI